MQIRKTEEQIYFEKLPVLIFLDMKNSWPRYDGDHEINQRKIKPKEEEYKRRVVGYSISFCPGYDILTRTQPPIRLKITNKFGKKVKTVNTNRFTYSISYPGLNPRFIRHIRYTGINPGELRTMCIDLRPFLFDLGPGKYNIKLDFVPSEGVKDYYRDRIKI